MKNMGLSRLVLVSPGEWKTPEALAMAWNSREILEDAKVHQELQEAVGNTGLLLGTSSRTARRKPLSPEQGARLLLKSAKKNEVSILFGPEDKGLSNEELAMCHSHIVIPAASKYPSLNLAQAVAIVCYELYCVSQKGQSPDSKNLASIRDLKGFFAHLKDILIKIRFLDPKRGADFMGDIKGIFQRAILSRREIRILRGVLRQIEWWKDSERK